MKQEGFVVLPVVLIIGLVITVGAIFYFNSRKSEVLEVPDNLQEASESVTPEESNAVSVPSPEAQETLPAYKNISASGFAYEDRSDDGIYNSDDPKLPNMQIYFIDSYSSQQIGTVFTNASGEFSMSYKVRGNLVIHPTAYNNFVPKSSDKTVSSNTSGLEIRFRSAGAHVPNQTIGIIEGNVYQDTNKNKIKDSGENPIYFYKLYLKDANGNYFNTVENAQATDPGGHFKYVNLPVPVNYILVLSNPTGEYEILQTETSINLTNTNFQNTNVNIPVYKY